MINEQNVGKFLRILILLVIGNLNENKFGDPGVLQELCSQSLIILIVLIIND